MIYDDNVLQKHTSTTTRLWIIYRRIWVDCHKIYLPACDIFFKDRHYYHYHSKELKFRYILSVTVETWYLVCFFSVWIEFWVDIKRCFYRVSNFFLEYCKTHGKASSLTECWRKHSAKSSLRRVCSSRHSAKSLPRDSARCGCRRYHVSRVLHLAHSAK